MTEKYDIKFADTDTQGKFVLAVPGVDETAEITFSKAGKHLIIVDHTGVPEALRGRGLAKILAERVVKHARSENVKIVPLCPFFKAQAEKHIDWNDIIAPR